MTWLETLALFEAGELPEEITQRFLLIFWWMSFRTMTLQYRLVRAWTKGCKSLFAIGDPDQSIYGFRGADAACFDRLAEDIPRAACRSPYPKIIAPRRRCVHARCL